MRRSVSAPLVAAPQRIRAGARRAGMAAGRSGPASSRTVTLDSRTATGVRLDAPVRIAGGQAGMKGSKRRRRRLALGFGLAQLIAALVLAGPSAVSAGTTVNLDQWATLDDAWQNGNLNGNNSRYPEGGIVPFRLALEGLSPGAHEIRLEYDFTAGGHKAYDFLATWNATNAGGAICLPSGAADGASLVSGAPWHVRTRGLDGSGAKNQDRSIQPSAIVGELPPGGPGVPTFPPVLPPALPPAPPPLQGLTPPNTSIEAPGAVAEPLSISTVVLGTVIGLSFALALTRPTRRRR